MLSLLHIEHIALIESADLFFGAGLNVLTGETGAGKSIVLDAISALMGERMSRDLIRTGESQAFVSGVFCQLPNLPWFEEMGIYPDENGELLISRRMTTDGKNICRVGARPCTALQLRALGRQLISIHGQHDSHQLLDERTHLGFLDRFGMLEPLLADYAQAYASLQSLRREMDALQMDEAEKSRRIDTLHYQIEELERADLRPGELEDLTERRELLRNSGKLLDAVQRTYLALSGDDEREGAVSLLVEAEHALGYVASLSPELEKTNESLVELRYAADDIAERIRELRTQFDFSPEELDQLESRLDSLYRLRKKYGDTTEKMLAYLEHSREELAQIELADDTLLQLARERETRYAAVMQSGQQLREARIEVAARLRARIEEELRQLDMPKVQFCAELHPRASGEPDQSGLDEVQFLMSANLGEQLKPIQKVASGGELARIMLALKNVLAENDPVSTLIFDEVDAGISGRAAEKVALKMGALALHRQLLCVTHLAQIAAMADLHFSVQKGERAERTHTEVCALSRAARIDELARLTGGTHRSEVMLKGAEELLEQAEGQKKHWLAG